MSHRMYISGAIAAILLAVVVGIFTIGSPNEARRDKFDLRRFKDLSKISRLLSCNYWPVLQPTLPNDLNFDAIKSYCGGSHIRADDFLDKETRKPYVYVRKNETEYSVCADFYDAEKARPRSNLHINGSLAFFDPETGCVTGHLRKNIIH